MLDAEIIQPSASEWASAPVLIRKRDGGVRWCIDYRKLNEVTVKDVYPLPLIDECLDTLSGNIWFSKLDANSAYYQIGVKAEDRKKTAFVTKYGLFEFVRMGFGLCNAPATFARAMNLVLRGLTWNVALAFLDDILVMGKDQGDHLTNLRSVFNRFREYGLKFKPKKCELFQTKVEFLGRVIGPNGVEMGTGYADSVREWPIPRCTREVESFLGFANYHRNFIANFAEIAVPLYEITGKKTFMWGPAQEAAWVKIKDALVSTPVLTLPNKDDPFILDTDASDKAIGAELSQLQNGIERTVAYASCSLTSEQKKYCTTRKELLAVVKFTRQFRHYLLGRRFLVRTDHNSLTWLLNFKQPQGQLARWLEELGQYNMQIQHRPGKQHMDADALSRLPLSQPCPEFKAGVKLQDLPCGGCKYCVRANDKWGSFFDNVDDAVPLATRVDQPTLVRQVVSAVTESASVVQSTEFQQLLTGGIESDPQPQSTGPLCTHIDVGVVPTKVLSVTTTEDSSGDNSFVGYSADQMKEKQREDRDLRQVIQWLETQVVPSEAELFLGDRESKCYWVNWDTFHLDERGVLYKRIEDDSGSRELLVVPHSLRREWLRCNRCKKGNRKARCPMKQFHAGVPMERVHLDFLGPLPKTENGNEYVLMMVDQFTKWVECIPLPSQTAEVTARAAINEFFSRFGYPFEIFTDQGRNFESELFQEVCKLLHIHKARTTPYRPSANGQVERYNRTLMDAVRCYIDKSQTRWEDNLAQLAGALRSAVNRHTGYTPNHLMLGREVNQPADLMFRPPVGKQPAHVDEYVAQLEESIRSTHELARDKLGESQKRMKRDYDLRTAEHKYSKGDYVYVLDTAVLKGENKKLSPPWKGPGVIRECISPYLYKVQLRKGVSVINHDRLKLCNDRRVPPWLDRAKGELLGQKKETTDQEESAEVDPSPQGEPAEVGPSPQGEPAEVGPSPQGESAEVEPSPQGESAEVGPSPQGEPAEVGPSPQGESAEVDPSPQGESAEVDPSPQGEPAEVGPSPQGESAEVDPSPQGEPAEVGSSPQGELAEVGPSPHEESVEVGVSPQEGDLGEVSVSPPAAAGSSLQSEDSLPDIPPFCFPTPIHLREGSPPPGFLHRGRGRGILGAWERGKLPVFGFLISRPGLSTPGQSRFPLGVALPRPPRGLGLPRSPSGLCSPPIHLTGIDRVGFAQGCWAYARSG
ncbi:uncharacterized protein LOC121389136 [Gigantopelta aegis]|uniref:uncharacterized protein LOC121389136 n=1 Tax=Gigantopelta aegis TaxID=1735272 RepID=UPI001B88DBD1|nr:uncharacterized protein LOC121389136 [Gigantopelta aegis]